MSGTIVILGVLYRWWNSVIKDIDGVFPSHCLSPLFTPPRPITIAGKKRFVFISTLTVCPTYAMRFLDSRANPGTAYPRTG